MTGKKSKSANSTEPVYLQTYRRILRDIQEKRWNPGDKLPADMVFAKQIGINHLTLKKALNRLAAEGFLVRTPGRGTFIADVLPVITGAAAGKRVAVIYDMVTEESFHGDIFLSIYKVVGELGLTLELLSANNSRTTQFQQIMSLFSDSDSAGCIVWSIMDMRQLTNLAAAKPENYPLIFINHKQELDIQGIDFSGYDDYGSGRKLGEYINSFGFKRCLICQAGVFKKKTTNIHRVVGLQSVLSCPVEIFSGYEPGAPAELCSRLREQKSPEDTAVVFISDGDYTLSADTLARTALTPFVFFTARKPSAKGILLSARLMAENAVRILAARRGGDDSFSITRRVTGTIV
ncbi:MAG: winged helix-turn-helix transcriptional regulator [Lentisphaeria bacterium]|nr:winged helix-turn-helix transcriptional regulator [Lentisphaeria bacterium]